MEGRNEQEVSIKKSNWIWPIILVLVAVGGGFVLFSNLKNVTRDNSDTTRQISTVTVTDNSPIIVEGGMYYFKPNEIRVKKGQNLKITFTSVEETHDFVIDEFNVQSTEIEEDKSEEITFVADKTGEFEFYCSLYDHREKGMFGKLIITE